MKLSRYLPLLFQLFIHRLVTACLAVGVVTEGFPLLLLGKWLGVEVGVHPFVQVQAARRRRAYRKDSKCCNFGAYGEAGGRYKGVSGSNIRFSGAIHRPLRVEQGLVPIKH